MTKPQYEDEVVMVAVAAVVVVADTQQERVAT
jgi:hypothetical protein